MLTVSMDGLPPRSFTSIVPAMVLSVIHN